MKKDHCVVHGYLSEENAYICKNGNSIRLRCKECCHARRIAYYQDNRTEAVRKSSEWKRANRDKVNAQVREDRLKNPEKYKEWELGRFNRNPELKKQKNEYEIARRVSITRHDYYEMFEKQNNKCAICACEETRMFKGKLTRLCLDHNHETGKVRELLCHACNTAIGKFKDSIDLLNAAILYLKKHDQSMLDK